MKPGAGGHEQEVALLGGQQDIGGVDSESCGDLLDHDPQRKTEILTHPARKRDTFYHRKTLSLILDGRVEASVLEQQRHVIGNQLHRIHVRLGQGRLLTPIESSECPDRRAAHAHRDDKESDGRHRKHIRSGVREVVGDPSQKRFRADARKFHRFDRDADVATFAVTQGAAGVDLSHTAAMRFRASGSRMVNPSSAVAIAPSRRSSRKALATTSRTEPVASASDCCVTATRTPASTGPDIFARSTRSRATRARTGMNALAARARNAKRSLLDSSLMKACESSGRRRARAWRRSTSRCRSTEGRIACARVLRLDRSLISVPTMSPGPTYLTVSSRPSAPAM